MAGETYVRMTTEISHDVILSHILPRLPVKTIARYRGVCKQWNSFSKTPMFYDLHHNHHQNNYKLLFKSTAKPHKFFSIDCEAPDILMSLIAPFDVDDHYYVNILTSCNGLICLGTVKEKYDDSYAGLILWNPISSEYTMLSKTNYHTKCYGGILDRFEMFYDSSEDDYKILRLTRCGNAYIYSLKSDSWRHIVTSRTPQSFWIDYCWILSVVLDEKIYFQAGDLYGDICIIRFTTKTEKFTKIDTLSGKQRYKYQPMFVDKGSLHLCVRDYIEKKIEVFKMNGDGEWTSTKTYLPKRGYFALMHPLHIMRNGNWLMHYKSDLYDVDMEKLNTSDHVDPLNKKAFCITGQRKFIESFVSPNRYI